MVSDTASEKSWSAERRSAEVKRAEASRRDLISDGVAYPAAMMRFA